MNFKLGISESINGGIKRISIEQIEGTVNELNKTSNDFDNSIHEARKYFKKIRAVIRLVRYPLGENLFKRENIFFRDTGRLLSRIRDASVMVESARNLYTAYSDEINEEDYKRLHKNLGKRASEIRKQFKKNQSLIEGVKTMLIRHIDEVRNWPLSGDDFEIIEEGLKLVYSRGQKAIDEIFRNPSAENFHEWRKRAKYLWYHIRILEEAWPETTNPLSDKLDDLTDCLGLEHDYSELRELLNRDSSLFGNEIRQQYFLNSLGRERLNLQSKAKSHIGFIYAETPEEFVKRIKSYWNQSRENLSY